MEYKRSSLICQVLLALPKDQLKQGAMEMTPLKATTTLSSRLGNQSPHFFVALGLGFEWLDEPVSSWPQIPAFQKLHAFAHNLPVDNSATERMIQRTYRYRSYGKKTDDNFQAVLHVVGESISKVPKRNTKKALQMAYGN